VNHRGRSINLEGSMKVRTVFPLRVLQSEIPARVVSHGEVTVACRQFLAARNLRLSSQNPVEILGTLRSCPANTHLAANNGDSRAERHTVSENPRRVMRTRHPTPRHCLSWPSYVHETRTPCGGSSGSDSQQVRMYRTITCESYRCRKRPGVDRCLTCSFPVTVSRVRCDCKLRACGWSASGNYSRACHHTSQHIYIIVMCPFVSHNMVYARWYYCAVNKGRLVVLGDGHGRGLAVNAFSHPHRRRHQAHSFDRSHCSALTVRHAVGRVLYRSSASCIIARYTCSCYDFQKISNLPSIPVAF